MTERPLLWPLVPLYRLGLALRERRFQPGSASIRRLRWPVVSVGNLSTGGSGKTPLVIALAGALKARGVQVDVLSRGYGRRRRSTLPLLVEPGGTAKEFGDEPLEIARAIGVPVFVAAERYEAGRLAERDAGKGENDSHPSDRNKNVARVGHPQVRRSASERARVHLLDDGFQHRRLHREVDILLLSRRDLNDHLLPAGNLREALRAAEHADVMAIPSDEPELESEIKSRGWCAAVWRVRRRMDIPKIDGPVAAFCGIARPEQFFSGIEAAGVRLAARFSFRDHRAYTQADLKRIADAAHKSGATALVTTEKDRVRMGALADSLPAGLALHAVPLRVEIEEEDAAIDWLMSRLSHRG
jgi:tetraacyldisaccharide 4'-kinase